MATRKVNGRYKVGLGVALSRFRVAASGLRAKGPN